MSEPFLAEIKIAGFNFAPRGFALCDGQILPISQNQSLFSLLGATYGGDGRTTFALPDLRGRTPVHRATSGPFAQLGAKAGVENVTLTTDEMPAHGHVVQGRNAAGTSAAPGDASVAQFANGYAPADAATVTHPADTIGAAGGGQAHDNMQPYQAVNFVIALRGLFPSRN